MSIKERLKLYVITDRRFKDEILSAREALEGGATSIQMRIKDASTKEMVEIGKKLRKITEEYGALFFVNDRVDVAMAVEADGVQVGSDDMPISVVRKIAPDLIVGASVYDLDSAINAEREGADYLGVGAVFPTDTKKDARYLGLDGLKAILKVIKIPVVAIGGITHENVREVLKLGVSGIAVISAILRAQDVRKATSDMRKIIDEYLG